MSAYTKNKIYTYVRNAIITAHSSAYVTSAIVSKPTSYPAVRILRIGHMEDTRTLVMSNTQNIWTDTFSVQVWAESSTKMEDAYSVMDTARSAFKALGFYQSSDDIPADEGTDSSRFSLTANFRRVIGSGDNMPTT